MMEETVLTAPKTTQMRLFPCCACNPLRSLLVRAACVLLAWVLVIVVGVLVYRNSLASERQEFQLKCENRKEVTLTATLPPRRGMGSTPSGPNLRMLTNLVETSISHDKGNWSEFLEMFKNIS
jgi:hypothetical protein